MSIAWAVLNKNVNFAAPKLARSRISAAWVRRQAMSVTARSNVSPCFIRASSKAVPLNNGAPSRRSDPVSSCSNPSNYYYYYYYYFFFLPEVDMIPQVVLLLLLLLLCPEDQASSSVVRNVPLKAT